MNQNQQCLSCIESAFSYWCTSSVDATSGICWNIDESKEECLGSSVNPDDYLCSNDPALPTRAEYLLCPVDSIECRDTEDLVINSESAHSRIDTSIVPTNTSYEYKTYIPDSFTFPVLIDSESNVTTTLTTASYRLEFDYIYRATYNTNTTQFTLIEERSSSGSSITATFDKNTSVYINFYSRSSIAWAGYDVYVDFSGEQTESKSDSGLSTGEIVGIVFGCIGVLYFFAS